MQKRFTSIMLYKDVFRRCLKYNGLNAGLYSRLSILLYVGEDKPEFIIFNKPRASCEGL